MAISKLILNGEVQMDVTSDTVVADKLLNTYTATKNDGTKIVGSYVPPNPVISSLTVSPTEAIQTFNAAAISGYKPVTVNAIASDYIGSAVPLRNSSNIAHFGNGIIVASSGYYSQQAEYTFPKADIDAFANFYSSTGIFSYGYSIEAGNEGYAYGGYRTDMQLPTKSATTYTPGSAVQYISSYQWLTGTQTILGDANLVASNIASGVSIFGVTGTHSGKAKHTATLTNDGDISGAYVSYNNTQYYTSGTEINYVPGETLVCFCNYGDSNKVYVNGEAVASATYNFVSYDYILPDRDIEISFTKSRGTSWINIVEGSGGLGTKTITANGTYDAEDDNLDGYSSVTVNVSGGGGSDAEDAIINRKISGVYENSRVSTIGNYAFASCSSLTTASFPSVTMIGTSAFYRCSSLTTVSFPSVTSIGSSAFAYCTRLTTASFPNVTTIGSGAFYNCSNLTTVSFPSVTSIGSSAFAYCTCLTTASFPSATSIGSSAFYRCSSLTTVSFPNVTTLGNYAFTSCYNLVSVIFLASSVVYPGANVFSSTPIDGYTTSTGGVYGSIYVLASLVDSYKTATYWSKYADRITSYVE